MSGMSGVAQRSLIIGLGKTGFSCARYLAALGEAFDLADTRTQPPYLEQVRKEQPERQVYLGPLDASLLRNYQRLIVSPGVSLQHPAIQEALAQGAELCSDIDLFCAQCSAPIIAITGSNAKSTVTTLVGLMAERCAKRVGVGGNLGKPVLEFALESLEAGSELQEMYVLELSSFQLEACHNLSAQVAAVLNVSPDHMDRYADFESYCLTKQRIYQGCQVAVYNRADAATRPPQGSSMQLISFGLDQGAAGAWGLVGEGADAQLALGEAPVMQASEVRIQGAHNLSNALAALAIGAAAGMAADKMCEVLREFEGLPHRCQWVREHQQITYFNDSKGTNVGASLAAIEGLGAAQSGKIVLIAGGDGKGADFKELVAPLARYGRAIVLIGRDAERLAADFAPLAEQGISLLHARDMEDAVQQAAKNAQPDDLVLLSPACASLDMFANYEARGEAFMHVVRAL